MRPSETPLSELPSPDLSQRAWADGQRPRFHFLAPAGWLNDPNGVSQWHQTFHLFYQYNPDAPMHANVHWGHASSVDLVHWRDEPIALTPSEGPDEDGCWSGVLVDDGGTPTLVYSGNRVGVGQRACLAYGDQDLRTWRKDPANPVIAQPPPDLELVAYRDHCVWQGSGAGQEPGKWRQLMGAGIRGRGGTALLYESDDLRSWSYLGPIMVGDVFDDEVWTGSMWECVDLFRLGPDHQPSPDVLLVSVWHENKLHGSVMFSGHFDENQFRSTGRQLLDFGLTYFYAPQSTLDESGRRILFGWIPEGRDLEAAVEAGWQGVMSLPRMITLSPEGRLLQRPVDEVSRLRDRQMDHVFGRLAAGEQRRIETGDSQQLDLEAEVVLSAGSTLELGLRATEDGHEQTRLLLTRGHDDPSIIQFRLDRSRSSLDASTERAELSGLASLDDDRINIRVLLDRSVVEIFVNGRPLTARIYPTRADALAMSVSAHAGAVSLERLDVWTMQDIWHGPRPTRP